MIAPRRAVIPIIRLLVAVATRSGTPISEVHQRDLDDPAADAEQRRHDARRRRSRSRRRAGRRYGPGPVDRAERAALGVDGRASSSGSASIGAGAPRRRPATPRPGRAGAPARRRGASRRDVDEQAREQAGEEPLVDRNAIGPPTSAPIAVNSSSIIPRRRFATWRWR